MQELLLLVQDQFLSLKFTFKVGCASFSQAFKITSHVINRWKQRCTVNPELIKLFQYLFLILNPELNLPETVCCVRRYQGAVIQDKYHASYDFFHTL